jgi:hypothetical protein
MLPAKYPTIPTGAIKRMIPRTPNEKLPRRVAKAIARRLLERTHSQPSVERKPYWANPATALESSSSRRRSSSGRR